MGDKYRLFLLSSAEGAGIHVYYHSMMGIAESHHQFFDNDFPLCYTITAPSIMTAGRLNIY